MDKDNMTFETDDSSTSEETGGGRQSFIMRLIMKMGAKDETTANYILIGLAVVFLMITVYLYAGVF